MALVLVIDDDRTVFDAIAVVVRQIGHEVRCASSFSEGLEESRWREFALVLVDVQLPDGSGLDLLPLLREKMPCPEVIIMTGHGGIRTAPSWRFEMAHGTTSRSRPPLKTYPCRSCGPFNIRRRSSNARCPCR